jgi:hypothetical protein
MYRTMRCECGECESRGVAFLRLSSGKPPEASLFRRFTCTKNGAKNATIPLRSAIVCQVNVNYTDEE